MEIHEGQIIDGLFKISRKNFSRGANGDIHLAVDSRGQKIALKFIRKDPMAPNPESFKKEYETLLKFSHPNVAKAFHFGEFNGLFYMAQEFVDGSEFRLFSIGAPPEKMVPFFIQAFEGLEAIHNSQWLHLDIKSSNVLVGKEGPVKIIDFGFAMALTGGTLPFIRGSLPYMAPEMVLKKPIDSRADLFSMGVLMYYAITGQYPFLGRERAGDNLEQLRGIVEKEGVSEKPSYLNVDIPPYLDEIILTLLSKNPQDRFGTARAIINALKTHHPESYKTSPEVKHSYLVPENNRHIGRVKEQKLIFASLEKLVDGQQPDDAIFWIEGDEGLGKSHLFKKIKQMAEKSAEKISIHFLVLPKLHSIGQQDNEWFHPWMEHLLQKLAGNKKPVLVLVDDVEELIPLLKNILAQAIQRLEKPELYAGQKPMLICLAGRRCLENHPRIVRLPLKAFSAEELKEYLAATPALRHCAIPGTWLETLYKRTNGNPAEVMEHLKQIDSQGLLFDLNGEISLAHVREPSIEFQTGDQKIPETTHQRLSGIIGNLSDPEKEVLRWMAVWSRRGFCSSSDISELEMLIEKKNLLPLLNDLVSKNLLGHEYSTNRYSFTPFSYLPHLIYNNIAEPQCAIMHQKICERVTGDAKLFHQAFGTHPHKAWMAVLKLGGRALYEDGKAALAKELFGQGLKMTPPYLPKLEIFLAVCLIKACGFAGLYENAGKIFEAAEKRLDTLKKKSLVLEAELTLSLLPVLINTQRFEQAHKRIEDILEKIAKSSLMQYQPIFLNCLAKIAYQKSFLSRKDGKAHLQNAKKIFEESAALEDNLPEFQRKRVRNNDLGVVLHTLGENERAAAGLEAKLSRLEDFPNIFIQLNTLSQLAEVYRLLENFPKAFECACKALKIGQKTGMGKWILYAYHILAGIHQAWGLTLIKADKHSEAEQELERALNENTCFLAADACLENRKEAQLYLLATFLRNGQCCQELKKFDQAITYFKAAIDFQPSEIYLGPACLGLGECYLEKGDIIKAAEFLNKSSALVSKLPPDIAKENRQGIAKAMLKLKSMETGSQHAQTK